MPRNVYWEIYLHLIWRTKDSEPMLRGEVERRTHNQLIHRALNTKYARVHAIGGTDDHVHMAVSLPPTCEISAWVGDLKGGSAHAVNHGESGRGSVAWQTGYGVVTFGERDLPWVVAYIRNQREHHRTGRVHDRLEMIERPAEMPEGEDPEKPAEAG